MLGSRSDPTLEWLHREDSSSRLLLPKQRVSRMTSASPPSPPPPPPPAPSHDEPRALRMTNHVVTIVGGSIVIIGGIYSLISWLGSTPEPPKTDNQVAGDHSAVPTKAPHETVDLVGAAEEMRTENAATQPVRTMQQPADQSVVVGQEPTRPDQVDRVELTERAVTPIRGTPVPRPSSCPTSVVTLRFDPSAVQNSRTAFRRMLSQGVTSVRISDCQPSGAFRTGGGYGGRLGRTGSYSSSNIEINFAYYHAGTIECSASGTATGSRSFQGSLRCDESVNGTGVSIPSVEITF